MRLDGGGVLRMRVRTREAANCAGVLGWRDFSEAAAEVTAQAAGGAPGLEGAAAVAQDVAARPLAAEGDLRARISGTEAAAGLASRGQEVADLPRDTIRVAPAPVSLASDLSAQPRPVAAPRQPALGDPGRCGLLRGSSSRMSSVIRSEAIEVLEEEPVTSKTYDHPLKSDPIPVEVCSKSPASLEMIQRVSEERIHPGSSPKMGGNCDLIHQEGLQSRSLHLSPQEQSPDRQDKSQSWRRASMKEISRRKSLPAFHQGITELSRSISANLAESKRLGALLLSSFQFSVQKLEPFLKDMEGFSLESFRAKASSLSEELKHFAESLESNGTLQKCFEDSKGKASDLSLETSVAEMKEYITKFSLERQSWDQLLQHYQMEAEEITSRTSAETKVTEVEVEPKTYLGSSQSEVLSTKPDYQKILQNQNKVFDYMELVMDELQGSVKQLHAFMDESTQCFQKVSVQLGKRSTQQLDPSPARKLLKLQLQNPPTTHCSRSCQ